MRQARSLASGILNLRFYAQAHPMLRLFEDEKRHLLVQIAQSRNLQVFIETGTYLGKTVECMTQVCERCISIEIDELLHDRARERLRFNPRIELLRGDSREVLPHLIDDLRSPALFWLDGHWSGGRTGRGSLDSPVMNELRCILNHEIQDHVIVIDDARLFRGRAGYPTLRKLESMVTSRSPYKMALQHDLIRIQREDI